MNEVWVPSRWQRETFVASGVDPAKIRVVPEGVNTTLFDPVKYGPLTDLTERAHLVFGRRSDEKLLAGVGPAAGEESSGVSVDLPGGSAAERSGAITAGPTPQQRPSAAAARGATDSGAPGRPRQPFRFISSFKWEVGLLGG
jgi:hypothetical protein